MTTTNDGYEEVKSGFVKFNVPDDYVKGTLIDIYVPSEMDQWGKKNRSFILKADEGTFHGNDDKKVVDTTPTKIEKDSIWRVGSKPNIDAQMTSIRLGQKIMFKLKELRPSKKGNPAKIIQVYKGPLDEPWLAENASKIAADKEFENA